MVQVYPNPSRTGMRFDFLSPLGMDMVTCKYNALRHCNRDWKTTIFHYMFRDINSDRKFSH